MVAQPARAKLLSPARLARPPRPNRGWASFKPEIAIFAVAVVLRVALFVAVGAWNPARLEKSIFVGDARDYHHLGVNLAEHGVYSSKRHPPLTPNTFRVPLYPFYLSILYRLFGPQPHLAILAQLALGALTCVVVCRLGTLLFDRRAGIAAGTILAVDYSAVLFSNRLYADTLFTLLVVLGVLAVARFLAADGRLRSLAAAGAVLGLATLCRPVSLYFVIALAPVLWLAAGSKTGRAPGRRQRSAVTLAACAVLFAAYLAALSPWMLRNLAVEGRLYVTSMQTHVGTWYLPSTVKMSLSLGHLAEDALRFGRGFVRYFAILGSGEYPLILGIRYQRHDAVALRDASLKGWITATLRNRTTPLQRAIVGSIVVYLTALYLAAARGLWIAARRGGAVAAALLVATVVYFMIATGPIAREVRYRLPALPSIVLLAGLGLTASRNAGQTSRSNDASSSASAA
jgi:4-amino-4-deoxy-L-arabinose transferase-like glycosyltransferase